MLIKIIFLLVVIVLGLVGYASTKPNDFRYTRTIVINASADAVFPYVNNLHKWLSWSPWAKMDPNAKNTFSGPAEGKDASTSWIGEKTGEGRMTVVESTPNEFIKFKLEFFKPFKAVNTAEFSFKEDTGKTTVSWTMYGPQPLMGKIINLVMNCEKMIGTQFDQGLADLKKTVEAK